MESTVQLLEVRNDSWDSIYDNPTITSGAWKDYADGFILDRFTHNLTLDTKIIEIGCGDGRNLLHLLKLGYKVTGIDISATALERTIEHANSIGLAHNLTLVQADAQACNLASESFDVAFATQVLDHVNNPASVVREVHRLLKNGGRFYVQFSSTNDTAISLGIPLGNKQRDYHGFLFSFFDKSDLDVLFADWQVIDISRVVINDPPHPGWREEPHEHDYWVVTASKTES